MTFYTMLCAAFHFSFLNLIIFEEIFKIIYQMCCMVILFVLYLYQITS